MANQTKAKYSKNRKPIIVLVCEGKNQTERLYFNHFNTRYNNYTLKIKDSEATDIINMAKKANSYFSEYQLDKKLGDHIFCLIDLDLDTDKIAKYERVKTKYKNVEFIVSNPCFEIWLLYYFVDNPKVENSSQKVKEQMLKYVSDYTESTDVIAVKDLEDNYAIAINRSVKKNGLYQNVKLLDKNPYTEIQNIITIIKSIK